MEEQRKILMLGRRDELTIASSDETVGDLVTLEVTGFSLIRGKPDMVKLDVTILYPQHIRIRGGEESPES